MLEIFSQWGCGDLDSYAHKRARVVCRQTLSDKQRQTLGRTTPPKRARPNLHGHRTVRLSEAPSFGKSILEYDPSGAGASAYRALAREFIKRHSLFPIARETERTHSLESLEK